MVPEAPRVQPLLRAYAWLALISWFGGMFFMLVTWENSGGLHWPVLLVIAGSVPVVPLLMRRGPEILADRLDGIFGDRRPRPSMPVALVIFLILLVLNLLVWTSWGASRLRERVREFVGGLGSDAVVLVDGEHFLGERRRALLEPLAGLSTMPAHHSHPEEAFLVRIEAGGRTMELELCRDCDRPREYWVYLYGDGEHRETKDIGHIETDALDDLVPIRPPKMRRAHDPNFR